MTRSSAPNSSAHSGTRCSRLWACLWHMRWCRWFATAVSVPNRQPLPFPPCLIPSFISVPFVPSSIPAPAMKCASMPGPIAYVSGRGTQPTRLSVPRTGLNATRTNAARSLGSNRPPVARSRVRLAPTMSGGGFALLGAYKRRNPARVSSPDGALVRVGPQTTRRIRVRGWT